MITRCGAPPEYRRVQSWSHPGPYHKRYKFIPLTQISPDLQHSVVAAEDARFYQHHGFDWHEIQIAAEDDMEGEEIIERRAREALAFMV